MGDRIGRYVSDREMLAVAVVRATDTVRTIAEHQHGLRGAPAALLGETILGVLMLGTRLKGPGKVVAIVQTDGAFDHCRADAIGLGNVRAMVRPSTRDRLHEWNGVDRLFGTGHLQIHRQVEGRGQAYQTHLEIADAPSVRAAINQYLRRSEQVPAAALIDIRVEAEEIAAATGIYVERLPGRADETGLAAEKVNTWFMQPEPVADLAIDADDRGLLDDLLGAGSCELLHEYPVGFFCPCSKERYTETLKGFADSQLQQLADDDGLIRTTCDFCCSRYDIPLAEVTG